MLLAPIYNSNFKCHLFIYFWKIVNNFGSTYEFFTYQAFIDYQMVNDK